MRKVYFFALFVLLGLVTAGFYKRLFSQQRQLANDRFGPIWSKQREILSQELANKGFELGSHMYIRAFKRAAKPLSARRGWLDETDYFDMGVLEVWMEKEGEYQLYKKYFVQAASGSLGPKQKQGDKQVPEGIYAIGKHSLNPASKYHLSMNIGYPNTVDRQLRRTGNYIMIHGSNKSVGCFAIGDSQVEELYSLVYGALYLGKQRSIPVHIFPFELTSPNMDFVESDQTFQRRHGEWFDFWGDLAEIYQAFERDRQVPHVDMDDRRYFLR